MVFQVQREREEIARGERRDPSEAAIKIQSAWRMRQAQQELHRLRQAQEAQAEATATRQVAHYLLPTLSFVCAPESAVSRFCNNASSR